MGLPPVVSARSHRAIPSMRVLPADPYPATREYFALLLHSLSQTVSCSERLGPCRAKKVSYTANAPLAHHRPLP